MLKPQSSGAPASSADRRRRYYGKLQSATAVIIRIAVIGRIRRTVAAIVGGLRIGVAGVAVAGIRSVTIAGVAIAGIMGTGARGAARESAKHAQRDAGPAVTAAAVITATSVVTAATTAAMTAIPGLGGDRHCSQREGREDRHGDGQPAARFAPGTICRRRAMIQHRFHRFNLSSVASAVGVAEECGPCSSGPPKPLIGRRP